MVEHGVDVGSESLQLDRGCAGERGDGGTSGDELPLSEGYQFPDWHAVPRHDEGLATVQRAHDFAALVAQLPLRDLPCHARIVARVLRRESRPL